MSSKIKRRIRSHSVERRQLTPYYSPENEEYHSMSPIQLDPGPIQAPASTVDPRYLDKGKSKMVWLMVPNANRERMGQPKDNTVVVNSFDTQLFRRGKTEAILRQKIESQRNEYEFTRMMKSLFPDLIPGVYELHMEITPLPRFRYIKDRCEPLQPDANLFYEMIRISDRLIEQGWVFLDMKPGNIGLLNRKVVLLDTDPHSFYRIPDPNISLSIKHRIRNYYKECCHMIILLFCLNFVNEIPTQVLQRFIRSKGYTEESFHETYGEVPASGKIVSDFNNRIYEELGHSVRVLPEKILDPITIIDHYGQYEGIHPLTRLVQIIDYRK